MPRQYNFIYSKLVRHERDIAGHIAYSTYKAEKVAYIEKFKNENGGKEPTESDLKPFNDITCTEIRLSQYRKIGDDTLDTFIEDVVGAHMEKFEQDCVNNHIALISQAMQPMKSPPLWQQYFHAIAQSVLGAFVFMLLMCFLLFLLKFSEHSYTITLGGNGNAEIKTEKVESVPKQIELKDSIR